MYKIYNTIIDCLRHGKNVMTNNHNSLYLFLPVINEHTIFFLYCVYHIILSELLLILFCFRKIFIIYKNMLKIYFDYSNGANAITQKGCILLS